MEKEQGDVSDPGSSITVTIKFRGQAIPITLSPDSSVKDLKSLLQPLTDVLTRGQKLIFKGKLLVDSATLRSSEVTNGSKIMLMASQGLHQGIGITDQEKPSPELLRLRNDSSSFLCGGVVSDVDCPQNLV